MTITPPLPAGRQPGIDSLRAFAVLAVVAFHYLSRFDPAFLLFPDGRYHVDFPGWVGVDLFFIISGYCIAMTAYSSVSLADFWAKRIARIYPALLFCGAVTTLFYLVFELPGIEVSILTALGNFLMLNFIASVDHIDGAYWSLAVELKFYVLFGVMFYFCRTPTQLVVGWLAFCAAGWVWDAYDLKLHKLFLFPHSLMFLAGITLYHRRDIPGMLIFMCFAVITSSFFFVERYAGVPFVFVGILGLASFVIYYPMLLWWRPLVFVGLVSYSWYLIHQNIGAIIIREVNKLGLYDWSIQTALTCTFGIAVISYYVVEGRFKKPVRGIFYLAMCRVRLDRAIFGNKKDLV